MGCTGSSNIDVKRCRIQLFEQNGEEEKVRNAPNKKESIQEEKYQNPVIYKSVQTYKKAVNSMNNSQEHNRVRQVTLKTMTFNIANQDSHKGFSKYRARNIAKHIDEEKPDVIGLQELRENTCIKKNQLEAILKELQKIQKDFKWYALWIPSMHYKKMGVRTCAEGLGVMSRFPIRSFKQELIPLLPNAQDKNQRSVLFVELEDMDIQICLTHLSYLAEDQIEQTKNLRKIIDKEYVKSELNLKQIILGDFNYHDEEKSKFMTEDEELRGFKDTAVELKNIQNTWKLYRYDRIYYRGSGLLPIRINAQSGCQCNVEGYKECEKHYCSDHYSLTSEFLYEF